MRNVMVAVLVMVAASGCVASGADCSAPANFEPSCNPAEYRDTELDVLVQYIPVCSDDVMVGCHRRGDTDRSTPRDWDAECVSEGWEPTCRSGVGEVRCVPVPCDGELHRAGDL